MADQKFNPQEADGHVLVGQDEGLSTTISNSPFETLHFETSLQTAWHQIKEVLMVQKAEGADGRGGQTADGQPEEDFDEGQERRIPHGVRR